MLGRLKHTAKLRIGRNRHGRVVRSLHRVAQFVENAYANVGSDFDDNGERAMIEKLVPADFQVAFDVGANVGRWTIQALARWPQAHVHAFEVAPGTFDRLDNELRGRQLQGRATLNNCGLSDASGNLEMFFYPDSPELTCDRPRHEGRAVAFQAKLAAGDGYLQARRIPAIDFLKVDVEGSEYRVLDGLERSIAAGLVHCIQFEYGAFSIDTRVLLKDYYRRLSARYWIGKIFPTHVEFTDYVWTMEDFKFSNFMCVSRHRPDLKRLLG